MMIYEKKETSEVDSLVFFMDKLFAQFMKVQMKSFANVSDFTQFFYLVLNKNFSKVADFYRNIS
jgi:hypothetical protein